MLEFKAGDIFNEGAEAIVNTVNCVGVMGRGIALQFKKRFPENFKLYEQACRSETVLPGKMFVYKTGTLVNPKYIINFPTKRHWRGKSRLEDIEAGLLDLVQVIQLKKIKSLALPPLGCGLGGLSWASVKPCIEEYLSVLTDVHIIVFEPQGAPAADKMAAQVKVSGMTPGRAALLELMHRYLGGLLDPFVTLLEAHKLMYFLQESGEDLRLKYAKAPYGPYAENLRHVFNAIEGHFISGYADGGDLPNKRLELFPEAVAKAREYLLSSQKTSARLERVADLVTGFESPSGLELLSTVHWTVKKEKISEKEEVISYIHSWSERKKRFSSRQIDIALNVLSQKGWISYSDK